MSTEPTSATILDPYTTIARWLWNRLEADAEFAAMVRPGNRIKFMYENRDPIKSDIQEGDTPEVRIIPTAGTPNQAGSSCSVFDAMQFEIQISTGDQRIDQYHCPLKWIVFRVLNRARLEHNLPGEVLWNGKKFISAVRLISTAEGVAQDDLNRGITGWATIWAVSVEMMFAISDL